MRSSEFLYHETILFMRDLVCI